jgi:hypothetical protein
MKLMASRIAMGALFLVAASCTLRGRSGMSTGTLASLHDEPRLVGHSHQAYGGKPAYLAAARPLQPTVTSDGTTEPPPCPTRSAACDARLRATLAALDGQVLALATPASDLELQALGLTVRELGPLLAPWGDLGSQHKELAQRVDDLKTQAPAQQAETKKRMITLADLLRVQVAGAD